MNKTRKNVKENEMFILRNSNSEELENKSPKFKKVSNILNICSTFVHHLKQNPN